MMHPDLDELVLRARRERAAPGALAAVARSLRVPFAAAPVAAIVAPSTAIAGIAAKMGLSRLALLGWGAGSTLAVSGMVAAVVLNQPPAAAPVTPPPIMASSKAGVLPAPVAEPVSQPDAPVAAPSVAAHAVKDVVPAWDEPQLIERARKALGSDPRRALLLAQEHQRRFPSGSLGIEREVIVLEALARSGQTVEAKRRALAFEAKYPKSIHLPHVRALLSRLGEK